MKKVLPYICFLVLVSACAKEHLTTYKGNNNIYMSVQGFWIFIFDTSNINFARYTPQDSTLRLNFNIVGQMAPVNRKFKLVVSDSSTAVANRDYVLPPEDSFYIESDSIHRGLPLKIMRSAALYEKSVKLILKLQANENFSVDVPTFSVQEGKGTTTLRITISDILPAPDLWENNRDVLALYTRKKLSLMVKVLSLELDKFYESPYSAMQLRNFARKFQTYLNQQKASGNTIYEEDGSAMVMGPDVQ